MHNQRLPLVTVISVFSKHCPWTSEASWRTVKSKLQAWCIKISGSGDGEMAIFLNFKNHSPRILSLGPKILDLSINNQQWTFKYFSENSSILIKEKKMRKRLHSITYPASRQYLNHIESSCNLYSSATSIYFIRSKEIKELGEKSYLKHNDKSQSGC